MGRSASASTAAAVGGALLGMGMVVLVAVIFFQWAGGITPYDIVTLDQAGRLELEGLSILYMQVVIVVLGAPLGCWWMLRRQRAPAAGATALLTIAWSWLLHALVLPRVPSGPEDPVILPFAFVSVTVAAAAFARATTLLIPRGVP